MKRRNAKSPYSVLILLLNTALLLFAFLLLWRYISAYQIKLREENLSNIANLNQSAASNATTLISSWSDKLSDMRLYVEKHDMTREELLSLLRDTNANEKRQFQLIGPDLTGFIARTDETGAYIPISYKHSSYASIHGIFTGETEELRGGVSFVPEFTDGYTALKDFAIYTRIPLTVEKTEDNETGKTVDTLMLTVNAREVLEEINKQDVFEGLSNVLIDQSGNYIVSSADFKSTNFFQYLYVYNDLTLDERSVIAREMADKGSGELYYRNSEGKDCVFRYARMSTNDWYCVTSVPLSSFRSVIYSYNYPLYAIFAILCLLLVDVLWMRDLNKRLRASAQREKEASGAKSDFLSRMSHDIRTPLNGVIGLTLLAMDEPNPPQTNEYLGNIKSCGDFLLGLVNDILDLSKVESGKMELSPARYTDGEFSRYIEAVIAPLCNEKRLTLTVTPPKNDLPVLFDHLRLNQIFFNLLSNAVKYTPEGGAVSFSWTREALPGDAVAFDFVVKDNGIGMSEEYQKHMFESFSQERTSTRAQGSGLGLAIVWNLVKLMGGEISVESKTGVGTTFTVHLETTTCSDQEIAPVTLNAEVLVGKHVLLCEDNNLNAIIAQRLLKKWGVETDIAENGRVGVERFSASLPYAYDMILMDIQMPEMGGLEATSAIRALARPDAKSIPIIAMTANIYNTDIENCLAAGMNAHTGKPLQPEQLRNTLIQYMS